MAERLWYGIVDVVPKKYRKETAIFIVNMFEDEDCDTMDEAYDLMKAAGLEDRHEEDCE